MTSLAGQFTPADQPSLKLYSDENGNEVTLQHLAGLPCAFFEFGQGWGKSALDAYDRIMVGVEIALKEEGLDRYYILVGSQKDYDYAMWMGYEPTGYHIQNSPYEILGKIL